MQTIKKGSGILLCIMLVAAAVLSGCRPPGVRALFKGKALLEQGKYAQAVPELRAATVLLPTNALAFNYFGLALHHAGQSAEAERAYLRALALNHDLFEVRYNLGCLYYDENRLEQAKAELTAFTLRRVNSIEGWMKLGNTQLRNHEPGAAERSFSEALRLAPNDAEALTAMGVARLERNRAPEAIEWFNKALKVQHDYPPAVLNLAIVSQEQLKNKPLALQQYRYYLNLKPTPDNAEAVREVVRGLEQELAPPRPAANPPAGTLAEAKPVPPPSPAQSNPVSSSAEKKTAVLNPAPLARVEPPAVEPKTSPTPAPVRTPTSSSGSALRELREAAAKAPPEKTAARPAPAPTPAPLEVVSLSDEPALKVARDVTAPGSNRPAETSRATSPPPALAYTAPESKAQKRGFLQRINPARLFSSEEKSSPPTAATVSHLPNAEASIDSAGKKTGVLAGYSRYSYLSPSKPEPGNHGEAERAFAQAFQAQRANHLPEAIAAYRRATQIDPAYFDAYYNLGLAAMESGNVQLALATYETALALRPEALDARYNFALALKQANFPIDAVNELNKLLLSYPNEGRAHLALGNLYAQQLHDPAKARQHYLKVLETDPRNPQAGAIRYWLTDNPG